MWWQHLKFLKATFHKFVGSIPILTFSLENSGTFSKSQEGECHSWPAYLRIL